MSARQQSTHRRHRIRIAPQDESSAFIESHLKKLGRDIGPAKLYKKESMRNNALQEAKWGIIYYGCEGCDLLTKLVLLIIKLLIIQGVLHTY